MMLGLSLIISQSSSRLRKADTKPYLSLSECFGADQEVSERTGATLIVEELQEKVERLDSELFIREKQSAASRRRDRHDIIAEILKTAREGKKKTNIMYKARLSHSQLKLYLGFLAQNGMIMKEDGVYRTTSKGLAFIEDFESMSFLFRQ